MMATAWAQHSSTLPTLRSASMRRSSARIAGTGMPVAVSRSVGRTSGRRSAAGHHGERHGCADVVVMPTIVLHIVDTCRT